MHIFAAGEFFAERMDGMVLIYGEGGFDNYLRALAVVGAEAVVSTDIELARRCVGLLLPGGGDIFGILPRQERAVITAFVCRRRPILGVCRGMQALNVYFGGTLHRHIEGHQQPQGDMVHPTRAEGLPAALLGAAPWVSSNHHQAVDVPGEGLVACQWAEDGVVEAIMHSALPILGVQYHPERQTGAFRRADAVDTAPLFRWWTALL